MFESKFMYFFADLPISYKLCIFKKFNEMYLIKSSNIQLGTKMRCTKNMIELKGRRILPIYHAKIISLTRKLLLF